MELVVVALASFTAAIFLMGAVPFSVPVRLMPLALSGIGYGMDVAYRHDPKFVQAAAVAALVVIITRYSVKEAPGPWHVDDLLGWLIEKTPRRKPAHRRLPAELPKGVGRRIPSL